MEANHDQEPVQPNPSLAALSKAKPILDMLEDAESDADALPIDDTRQVAATRWGSFIPWVRRAGKRLSGNAVIRVVQERMASWVGGFGFGLLLGGGLVVGFFLWHNPYRAQMEKLKRDHAVVQQAAASEIRDLTLRLENAEIEITNLRAGSAQMSKLFDSLRQGWENPPSQPEYRRIGKGFVIYWLDGRVWREYTLYQGIGSKGQLKPINSKPMKRNFIYLPRLKPGVQRFAVSAVNRQGRETAQSPVLTFRVK